MFTILWIKTCNRHKVDYTEFTSVLYVSLSLVKFVERNIYIITEKVLPKLHIKGGFLVPRPIVHKSRGISIGRESWCLCTLYEVRWSSYLKLTTSRCIDEWKELLYNYLSYERPISTQNEMRLTRIRKTAESDSRGCSKLLLEIVSSSPEIIIIVSVAWS